jgi:dCMP deaminase
VSINDDRLERPTKYSFIEHAERNAIYHAARNGERTIGGILYAPWFACADCARAIIQAGITTVVGHKQMFDHAGEYHWNESIAYGNEMLKEAGVETFLYDGPIGNSYALFNGETWEP